MACDPESGKLSVHLGIFRNRVLSENMLTFRLPAGNFNLTYFLPNVVVLCILSNDSLKNMLEFILLPFYVTYFESQETAFKCVFLSPFHPTQFEEVTKKL